MIIRPEAQTQEAVDYYLAHYDEVHIVTCSKCKDDIAIEVRGQVSGIMPNSTGFTVIPISNKLLGSRVRMDEHAPGEPMIGYLCLCGNDTRASVIEEKASPSGQFLPHEQAVIMERLKNHKPKFRQTKNKQYHETFVRERVK